MRGGGSDRSAAPARPAAGRAGADSEAEAKKVSDELPLTQQVGRLVVLRFAGTGAPGYVRRVLSEGRAAGAILFRDNLTGPGQAKALAGSLREGRRRSAHHGRPGGRRRPDPPWAPPARSQSAQAAAGTVAEDAEAAARALRATGVNVTLAPVGDVAERAGRGARRTGVLDRLPGRRRRDGRVRARLAGRARGPDREALPGPRRRRDQHGRRPRDDRAQRGADPRARTSSRSGRRSTPACRS